MTVPAPLVLFDIGNTETVIATADTSEVKTRRRAPTSKLTDPDAAREWIEELPPSPTILVSTVVPALKKDLSGLLGPRAKKRSKSVPESPSVDWFVRILILIAAVPVNAGHQRFASSTCR